MDSIVQCFTSPPTQYRLYGRENGSYLQNWTDSKLNPTCASKLPVIKHKKLTSLQPRVRATKSHIQNSTNHFLG